jgi:uncharacterized protein
MTSPTSVSHSPSQRTRIRRSPLMANYERESLYRILDDAYLCHIAFQEGQGCHCIPTAFWRMDNYLYIHGATAGRLTKALLGGLEASLAVTHLDGLVLARSAFSHTMNYRSAVVYGRFELVAVAELKRMALAVFMDKIALGRKLEARPGNVKELAATSVLRISLDEASAKISNSGPVDKEEDIALPVWAGVLPLKLVHGQPIAAENYSIPTPSYVANWAEA